MNQVLVANQLSPDCIPQNILLWKKIDGVVGTFEGIGGWWLWNYIWWFANDLNTVEMVNGWTRTIKLWNAIYAFVWSWYRPAGSSYYAIAWVCAKLDLDTWNITIIEKKSLMATRWNQAESLLNSYVDWTNIYINWNNWYSWVHNFKIDTLTDTLTIDTWNITTWINNDNTSETYQWKTYTAVREGLSTLWSSTCWFVWYLSIS